MQKSNRQSVLQKLEKNKETIKDSQIHSVQMHTIRKRDKRNER